MSVEQLHPTHSPTKTLCALSAVFTATILAIGRILFRRLQYPGSRQHPLQIDSSIPLFGPIATRISISLKPASIRIKGDCCCPSRRRTLALPIRCNDYLVAAGVNPFMPLNGMAENRLALICPCR
jgi:hypothetical protein